jgi:hypothetical protein
MKVYIKLLQANSAYLSDVYVALMMLQVHFEGSEFGVMTDLRTRFTFILHPCHMAAAILDHRYIGYLGVDPKLMVTVLVNVAAHIAKRPESQKFWFPVRQRPKGFGLMQVSLSMNGALDSPRIVWTNLCQYISTPMRWSGLESRLNLLSSRCKRTCLSDNPDEHQGSESAESEVESLGEDESSVEVQHDEDAIQEPVSKCYPYEGEVADYNPDHAKDVSACLMRSILTYQLQAVANLLGNKNLFWFTGRRKGWYEGTINKMDDDGFNHQVKFPESKRDDTTNWL